MPRHHARVVRQGDIIFHQGDIGEKFYVIVQGKVEVEVKVHAGPGFNRNTSNSGWQTVAVLSWRS